MRAKQRSDRDLGTVHPLNYFDRGEILITKFPKFLEETKKEKEERGKRKRVEEKEEEKTD
jgi:hypothetical protein